MDNDKQKTPPPPLATFSPGFTRTSRDSRRRERKLNSLSDSLNIVFVFSILFAMKRTFPRARLRNIIKNYQRDGKLSKNVDILVRNKGGPWATYSKHRIETQFTITYEQGKHSRSRTVSVIQFTVNHIFTNIAVQM